MVYTNFFEEEFCLLCDFCYFKCTNNFIRSSLGEDICFSCFISRSEVENIKYIIFNNGELNLNESVFIECLMDTNDWKEIQKNIKRFNIIELKTKFYNLFGFIYKERKIIENKKSEPFYHEISSYAPKRNEFEMSDYIKELFTINIPHLVIKVETEKDVLNLIFMSLQNIFNQQRLKDEIILNRNLINIKEIKRKLKELTLSDYEIFNKIKQIIPFISKKQFNIFFNELRKQNYLEEKLNEEISFKKEKEKISKKITKIESQLCKKLGIRKSIYFKIKCKTLINKGEECNILRYLNMFSGREDILKIIYEFFKLNEWI